MRLRSLAVACCLTMELAVPARAQVAVPAGFVPRPDTPMSPGAHGATILVSVPTEPERRTASPWWAPLASAVVPGSGQAALGQHRAVPFLAVEGFALVEYLHASREGRDRRREYQDLARQVARRFLSDQGPIGNFEYYERMQQYVESGVYDLFPGGEIEPEADTTTYNGEQWLFARRTFWDDPNAPPPRDSDAYRLALAFYEGRAIRDQFRWSWRNAQLEQDLFRRTIQGSNDAFRLSGGYLSVIIANHALSAVDAFVTLRVRRGADARGYGVSGTIPWAPFGRRLPR